MKWRVQGCPLAADGRDWLEWVPCCPREEPGPAGGPRTIAGLGQPPGKLWTNTGGSEDFLGALGGHRWRLPALAIDSGLAATVGPDGSRALAVALPSVG